MTDMKSRKRPYVMTARAASAAATKARILASAVALYFERPIEDFTLDEVAARAGTTVRTVLRAYRSKDALIHAAITEMAAAGMPIKPTPPGDVAAGVAAFFDIYEAIGDRVVRQLADEGRRPELKPFLDEGREHHRQGVERLFASQLSTCRGAARAQLLSLLMVATDVYVWKLLRRDLGQSRAAAEAAMRRLIDGIIEGGNANDTDSVAQLVGRRQPAAEPRHRPRTDRARP